MLRTSGFSWDNEKNMVVCERQSYEDICRQQKNAQGLWNVSFPFYDQLTVIYGIDRATGVQSETFVEAIDNQEKETVDLDNVESDDDDEVEDNESVNQTKRSSPSEPSSKKAKEKTAKGQGRKRKKPEVIDLTTTFNNMSSSFTSYMNEMNMHMSTIASAFATTQQHEQVIMAREQEEENQKKAIINELLRIPGLTRYEALLASKKLASNSSDLSLFYQSPDDEWRKEFSVNLMHPNLNNQGT